LACTRRRDRSTVPVERPGYARDVHQPPRPEAELDFEECVAEALASLPGDLRGFMSNVELVVEDEPPPGSRLLGLYQGVPLTRRSSSYAAVPPDKITIFQGPLERHYGGDRERLRNEIRRVVLHEIAHHFGISDERLRELDRY
jgi:predicted Zn-dependent protease with MMP-like domain